MMKKIVFGFVLAMGVSTTGFCSGNLTASASARAEKLSTKMAKDLQLNNFQQKKVNAINMELVAEMANIEQKYQSNSEEKETALRSVYAKRDQKLENVLSTDQYTYYFRSRESLNKFDKNLVAELAQR